MPASFGATHSGTAGIVGVSTCDSMVHVGYAAWLPLLVSRSCELYGSVPGSSVATIRLAQPSQHCELVDEPTVDDDRAVRVDDFSIATPQSG